MTKAHGRCSALKVKECATINSGLVLSRKTAIHDNDVVKTYKQINLKSFNKNGYLDTDELETFRAKEIISKEYITQCGDIVIRLTDPFTAIYISKGYEGLIVSSNFTIVRCQCNVDAEFLSYYLNSDNIKKTLLSNIQGSIMKNINMSAIGEIEIPNISLSRQKTYAKLIRAENKKIKIMEIEKILQENVKKIILEKIGDERYDK